MDVQSLMRCFDSESGEVCQTDITCPACEREKLVRVAKGFAVCPLCLYKGRIEEEKAPSA
jgi:ribosomal protein L37AE/L43A